MPKEKDQKKEAGAGGDQKNQPPKIVDTKTREYLRYTFSDDEIRKMGLEMAQETQKGAGAEAEKKAAMANFKDRIEKHALAAKIAAGHIATGFEMRNIDCVKMINYEKNLVTITRVDTGEEVERREIEESERQMTLV